ncbi:hypothetical protein HK102_003750 [Quaeritorhiza haematococci]|nr:hypothetical protein HK102_003750 [Quaeritorhiza haematococci]
MKNIVFGASLVATILAFGTTIAVEASSYHETSNYYGGNDHCSALSYSEYGFPHCSDYYTGGFEYNYHDCLHYGYECEQSCVKKGSKKCEKGYEQKYYFHRPQSAAPRRHLRAASVRHANTEYYAPEQSYYGGHDYCSSYSASYSEFGFPWCSAHYTGGYEYNHSDCLEYGYECGQSCVKQGSNKCYADSYTHKSSDYGYTHTEPSKKYFRPAAVRHANTEQSYYTPEQPQSHYGGDYCSSYSASYSEFGFPWCSAHYTGGYEYNHSDCLEYGFECGQSCIKQGSTKCYGGSYGQEQIYSEPPQHGGYYPEEQQHGGYYPQEQQGGYYPEEQQYQQPAYTPSTPTYHEQQYHTPQPYSTPAPAY